MGRELCEEAHQNFAICNQVDLILKSMWPTSFSDKVEEKKKVLREML